MTVIAHLRRSEKLEGDFEAPTAFATAKSLEAFNVRRNSESGYTALKLKGVSGVWNQNGKLVHSVRRGADLAWLPGSSDLLSLEATYGKCTRQTGIKHTLKRLNSTFETMAELEICVPHGGVEYLALSPRGDRCVATWLDESEWGYVAIDVDAWRQLEAELYWKTPTLAPPAFSPDGNYVVACHYLRDAWWNDGRAEDPEEIPSPGGAWLAGAITTHDLATNTISRHDVMVTVPQGWLPDDPYNSVWNMLWGPEFITDREFRIWLPGGREQVLAMPLRERIDIVGELSPDEVE